MRNKHSGSNLNDYLAQEGLLMECSTAARKHVSAWQAKDKKTKSASIEHPERFPLKAK